MSITITIEAQTATEAAELVRDLAGTLSHLPPEQIPPTTVVSTVEKPTKTKPAPKAEEPTKEVAAPIDETEDVPDISDEQLRSVAREVGTTPERKAAIKALLAEYGVPNITAVPKAVRPQFLEGLKEIGK